MMHKRLLSVVKCKLTLMVLCCIFFTAAGHAERLSQAQINYMLQCQGCHKANAKGTPPDTPDMTEYGAAFMQSDAGRAYWTSVPGAANSPLSDAELADVVEEPRGREGAERLEAEDQQPELRRVHLAQLSTQSASFALPTTIRLYAGLS